VEEAAQRGEFGAERYEKIEFQKDVQQVFKSLQTPEWVVLDARLSIEELEEKIKDVALKTLIRCADAPFKLLS